MFLYSSIQWITGTMTTKSAIHCLTISLHRRKRNASKKKMDSMHVSMLSVKIGIHSHVNKEEIVNVPKNIMAVYTWKLKIYWRGLNSNSIQQLNSKIVSLVNSTIWLIILWVPSILLLNKLKMVKQIICLIWVKLILWKNQRIFQENYCRNMWIFKRQ